MTLHRSMVFALLIGFVPAIAAAQKTSYDFDKAATFSTYKTYSFKDGTKAGQPLIDQRIVAALENELKAKGFTKNDGSPDVFVLYHVAFDKQQDISAYSTGPMYGAYGYGWGGGWGTTTTDVRVRDIVVGSLAIDVVDAKKKQIAWRGLGTKEIDTTAKPEKRDKNIAGAVTKIMKNYPPKVKS
jgi:uncharacterized protein DUF4136